LAVAFLVLILALGSSMLDQTVQEVATGSRVKKSAASFHLAEAGIDYAAWKIYNGGGAVLPVTWTRSDLGTGTFTVTAKQFNGSATTLVLDSTGTTEGHAAEIKVIGALMTTGVTQENAAFDYALFSNAALTIKGSATVNGKVMANGNVTVSGNPTVTGSISSSGTISAKGSYTVFPKVPKISMPVVDVNHYKSEAGVILADGSDIPTTLNGVVFINGSAHINGTKTITGKGVIVVTGNVVVNGGAVINVKSGSEFAIVTTGSIQTNGNCTINGFLYAHNVSNSADFSGNGTASLTGGVVADVVDKASGNITITYKQPTVELPGAQGAPPQFAAISWRQVK
jgi:cytoskeletal protein CcmA (bactofilin family)